MPQFYVLAIVVIVAFACVCGALSLVWLALRSHK
jgi:hypothetical protein